MKEKRLRRGEIELCGDMVLNRRCFGNHTIRIITPQDTVQTLCVTDRQILKTHRGRTGVSTSNVVSWWTRNGRIVVADTDNHRQGRGRTGDDELGHLLVVEYI